MKVSEDSHPLLTEAEMDNCIIYTQLTARGLPVALFPGGTILVDSPNSTQPLAFSGSTSLTTTFGAMALSRKLPAAWSLLRDRNLPTPDWRIYASTAAEPIAQYCQTVGYPIAISGLKGQRYRSVQDATELRSALAFYADKPSQRLVLRPKRSTRTVRMLVFKDVILGSTSEEPNASTAAPFEAPDSLVQLARSTVAAIPNLLFAEVILEIGSINSSDVIGSTVIAQLNFAPHLRHYHKAPYGDHEIADLLIRHQAELSGISVGSPREHVTNATEFFGLVEPHRFYRHLLDHLATTGHLRADAYSALSDQSIRVDISGPPSQHALLALQALHGFGATRDRAHGVEMKPSGDP